MSYDKLIFEISKKGRIGHDLNIRSNNFKNISKNLLRETSLNLPEVTEPDVVRHYTNLSMKNFGVDTGFYPLGSCTMKYNPKINEVAANMPLFTEMHPLTPSYASQGSLEIMYETGKLLGEITGMDYFSFAPFAGAHGELVGLMIIKKYHHLKKDFKRTKIIVPDSAHGTNPASASVAGLKQ